MPPDPDIGPYNNYIIIMHLVIDWQVNCLIRMVSGECGGVLNHKLSFRTGFSASLINTTSILLEELRYNNNYKILPESGSIFATYS